MIPDFRDPRVLLQALLIVEGISFAAFIAYSPLDASLLTRYVATGVLLEVSFVAIGTLLYLVAPSMRALSFRLAFFTIVFGVAVLCAAIEAGFGYFSAGAYPAQALRSSLVGAGVAAIVLAYFGLRLKLLQPAVIDAQFTALEARLRPHFLFNTINTAVSLIRSDGRGAELVLLNLSDLLRLGLDRRRLTWSIADELTAIRSYFEIERYRLSDRLHTDVIVDPTVANAQIPCRGVLTLVESLLYDFVERGTEGGRLTVSVAPDGEMIKIKVYAQCEDCSDIEPAHLQREVAAAKAYWAAVQGQQASIFFESAKQVGISLCIVFAATNSLSSRAVDFGVGASAGGAR